MAKKKKGYQAGGSLESILKAEGKLKTTSPVIGAGGYGPAASGNPIETGGRKFRITSSGYKELQTNKALDNACELTRKNFGSLSEQYKSCKASFNKTYKAQ